MKNNPLFLLSLVVLLMGCAEKPKSVGNGLPNNDGVFSFVDTTFTPSMDTSYAVSFAKGLGFSNLAGRISPTEESVTLLNFIPGSTVDSLKGAAIDTVELRLTVNYIFRPNTFPVTFTVVEIQRPWSQSTFTSDSLPAMIFGAKLLGTFSDSMNFASTVTARLDTAEVRRWADSYIDSTAPDVYGFAVQSPAGVSNGIIGFSTFSSYSGYAPQIFIRYTKNGKRDSLAFFSGEDTYATKYTGPATFSPITVRGGFGIRSKVQFDISSLVNKPIVNSAMLELTLDTAGSSFGGYSPDSLIALLGMSSSNVDLSDSTIYVYGFKRTVIAGQSPVYSFRVTPIADLWVRSVKPNYGLTLRWGSEYGAAEKAVFFSSKTTADINKFPKLKITYAKK